MMRPFHLRDLPLVHRLSERGVSLHSESALTGEIHPVRGALLHLLAGSGLPTYIWKAEQGRGAGFIQLQTREESHRGHILYLSATAVPDGDGHSSVNEDVWLPLLDQATIEVGQRGVHNLVAEVSETGPALPVLRRAGFAVYMRQDIWVLRQPKRKAAPEPGPALRPRRAVDDWDAQLLYANIVPRLVQLVEPLPPLDTGKAWVLREGSELTALAHLTEGDVGSWLRLFIHPNADAQAEEIVSGIMRLGPVQAGRPLFCCVPRYQSWLQGVLSRCGFELWGGQAVMVKHTVHHLRRPLPELAAVLESQGVTASSPVVQRYYFPKANGRHNGH